MFPSRPVRRGSVTGPLSVIGTCVLAATAAMLAQPPVSDWRAHPTKDFPLAGGNYSNHRYSALDKINTTNIQKLGGAWSLRLEEGLKGGQLGNLDATPIVLDGVMYITTGLRNVLAIDAKTGTVKWRYRPEESIVGANKGVVVADGKVIFGRRDNRLIALDQATGKPVWETVLTTQRAAYTSAAPVHYEGRIFIGTAGGDVGARGQIGAYDVKTGKPIWTFYTVPGPGERFGDTWEGDSYKYGGAGVWNHVAVDPELGMIYMGTGNAGPDTYGPVRGGDNLFTASVLALDMKTGAVQVALPTCPPRHLGLRCRVAARAGRHHVQGAAAADPDAPGEDGMAVHLRPDQREAADRDRRQAGAPGEADEDRQDAAVSDRRSVRPVVCGAAQGL